VDSHRPQSNAKQDKHETREPIVILNSFIVNYCVQVQHVVVSNIIRDACRLFELLCYNK